MANTTDFNALLTVSSASRPDHVPAKRWEEILKDFQEVGYVYLFKCKNYYKIGMSKDPWQRIEQFRQVNPFDVEFIASFKSFDAPRQEKALHDLCAEFEHRNEWFKLPESFAKNHKKWFKPSISIFPSINKALLGKAERTEKLFDLAYMTGKQVIDMLGMEDFKCETQRGTYARAALVALIEVETNLLSRKLGVSVGKLEEDRCRGLYEVSVNEVKESAGLGEKDNLLDYLSMRDLIFHAVATYQARSIAFGDYQAELPI